jgi:hypothetical protein
LIEFGIDIDRVFDETGMYRCSDRIDSVGWESTTTRKWVVVLLVGNAVGCVDTVLDD